MFKTFLDRSLSLAHLAERCRALDPECTVRLADTNGCVSAFARFNHAEPDCISYYDGPRALQDMARMGCFVTTPAHVEGVEADLAVASARPRQLFIRLADSLLREASIDFPRTHLPRLEHVSSGPSDIHPSTLIMEGAVIGAGCTIGPGCIVFPHVVIEDNVTVKSGCVIGDSGAAIDVSNAMTLSQPHLGSVWIERHTEIGSQANIVRGIFGATRIGTRSIIGNQVNVGHNVELGAGCWVGVAATLGGFTTVGRFTNIGMGSTCKNGLSVGAECNIAMGSVVTKTLRDGESCFGNPAKLSPVRVSAGPAAPFDTGESDG